MFTHLREKRYTSLKLWVYIVDRAGDINCYNRYWWFSIDFTKLKKTNNILKTGHISALKSTVQYSYYPFFYLCPKYLICSVLIRSFEYGLLQNIYGLLVNLSVNVNSLINWYNSIVFHKCLENRELYFSDLLENGFAP